VDSAAIARLADILVNYSTEVKKGDRVLIQGTELARPLIEEVYRLVLRNGGYPTVRLDVDSLAEAFFREAPETHLDRLDPIVDFVFRHSDVLINIRSSENTRSLTSVDPARQQRWQRTMAPLQSYIMEGRTRWCVTAFPTQALAQDAGMSLEEYANFVFGATNIDWPATVSMMQKVKAVFDSGQQVRLVGTDTDLTFSIQGRPGIVSDGKRNMPSGEVFYAPLEKTVNGRVYYEYPAIHDGREVSGIRLTFRDGRVVEAEADTGREFLQEMLDTDDGARYLGEFGIGTNFGIQKFTKNILFDEKIGGTIHLALGQAYTEGGGTNKSAIHWDMVKEMRQGGEVYLDGALVQKDGRFLFL